MPSPQSETTRYKRLHSNGGGISKAVCHRFSWTAILIFIALVTYCGWIIAWVAFGFAISNYTTIHSRRVYCLEVQPLTSCTVSRLRGDLLVGELTFHSYGELSFDFRYTASNGSGEVQLPMMHTITIRGPAHGDVVDLNVVPSIIPDQSSSSQSLPFHWSSNRLESSSVVVNSQRLSTVREDPEFYLFSIYTNDCPTGALFARLIHICQ